jgi:hypothetical protein
MFAMTDPNDGVPQLYTVDRINPGRPQLLAGQQRDLTIFNCDSNSGGKIAFCSEKILRLGYRSEFVEDSEISRFSYANLRRA